MFDAIDACIVMKKKQFALVMGCGLQYGENWIIGYMPPGVQYRYKKRIEPYLCHILQLPLESKPSVVSRRFVHTLSEIEKRKWLNAVIIAPYANTFESIPLTFWRKIIGEIKKAGMDVYTNVAGNEMPLDGTKRLQVSLQDTFCICSYCRGLISYRSGFTDVMAFNHKVRHVVINPGEAELEYNDITIFGSNRVLNVVYDDRDESLIRDILGFLTVKAL